MSVGDVAPFRRSTVALVMECCTDVFDTGVTVRGNEMRRRILRLVKSANMKEMPQWSVTTHERNEVVQSPCGPIKSDRRNHIQDGATQVVANHEVSNRDRS
jgi:hypothetical protein